MSRLLKRLGPSALRYCEAIAREPRKRQNAFAEHVMRRYISAHYERSEPQHLDRWPKRIKRANLNARKCEKWPSVGVQGHQAESLTSRQVMGGEHMRSHASDQGNRSPS